MNIKKTSTLDFRRLYSGKQTVTLAAGSGATLTINHGLNFLPVTEAWFQVDGKAELHQVTNATSIDVDTIYLPIVGYITVQLYILSNNVVIDYSNDDVVSHTITFYYLVYADKALAIS